MTRDMTSGKPLKLLISFALPLMLSSMLQQLYSICDSMIVGRLLGSHAFAAIGSASYLHWFPMSMLIGFAQGAGVVLAQNFGAKRFSDLRRAFASSLCIACLLGLIISGCGVVFLMPFLRLLQTPQELLPLTAAYLRVMWCGLIFTGVYNICASLLRAIGDSRAPFMALVVSTMMNIMLDFLLIGALRMGVEGAALATLISEATALLYCWRCINKAKDVLPSKADFRYDKATVREVLRLGIPPLLTFSVTATGELAVQAAINLCGVVFVTGTTAARRYFTLLNIIGSGLEGAVATYVGQNAGARQHKRIVDGVRVAMRFGLAASLFTSVVVFALAKPLILLFVPDGGAETLRIGVQALRVECVFLSGLYMLCMHRAAIQGLGNAIIPMFSGFMELALRLLAAVLLPLLFGSTGLYFTDAVTWMPTALMLILCYLHIRRRKLNPLIP